jgi:hypothetical protein
MIRLPKFTIPPSANTERRVPTFISSDPIPRPTYEALSYTGGQTHQDQVERVVLDPKDSATRFETVRGATCMEKNSFNENLYKHRSPKESDTRNCWLRFLSFRETSRPEQKRNIVESQANQTKHESEPETRIRRHKRLLCDATLVLAAAGCCFLISRYSQNRYYRAGAMVEFRSKPEDSPVFAYNTNHNHSNSILADREEVLKLSENFLVSDSVEIP